MTKKSYVFCFVAFIVFFLMVYYCGTLVVKEDNDKKQIVNEANVAVENNEISTQKQQGAEVIGYWLKTDNNYIVIYNSNGEIVTNTEISVVNFSERDKQILEKGIYIENAEDLFRYLESYTS